MSVKENETIILNVMNVDDACAMPANINVSDFVVSVWSHSSSEVLFVQCFVGHVVCIYNIRYRIRRDIFRDTTLALEL